MLFNDPGVHSTDAIEESVDHFASLTPIFHSFEQKSSEAF